MTIPVTGTSAQQTALRSSVIGVTPRPETKGTESREVVGKVFGEGGTLSRR